MKNNLIIGGSSNYGWNELKYWVNSIKRSGFSGDIVLVVTNISEEDIKKLKSEGVITVSYGKKNYKGDYESNSTNSPRTENFLEIWKYLSSNDEYNYVICTDVTDVIFQSDPVVYLDELFNQYGVKEALVACGEGLKYKDQSWLHDKFVATFNSDVYSKIQHSEVFNVGVIAGTHKLVRDLMVTIYQLSVNRTTHNVDQAVYNFLVNMDFCTKNTILLSNNSGWAINLGTTIHAIHSGSGDIGQRNDPTSLILYQTRYLSDQPIIADGIVYSSYTKTPSAIVHQYDTVSGLADSIKAKYEENSV